MRYPAARLVWVAAHALLAAFVAAQLTSERTSHALAAPASTARPEPTSKSPGSTPFAELRQKGKFARHGLTASEAQDVGYEMARNSFPIGALQAVVDDGSLRRFGQFLGERHLAWQLDTKKHGVHEQKLMEALGRHLELDRSPEYLKIHPRDVRRIRLQMWIQVPELSTGIDRRDAKAGSAIFERQMSPFEAYLISDLLLYQKRFNADYLRTDAEDMRLGGRPSPTPKPGLFVLPPNPRGLEFQRHMETVARKKWRTAAAVTRTVSDILDESGQ